MGKIILELSRNVNGTLHHARLTIWQLRVRDFSINGGYFFNFDFLLIKGQNSPLRNFPF
jgi:hypothetical protein